MLFLKGLIGFFRMTRITFVKKERQGGDIQTFYFKPKRPIHHIAGQHGLFILPWLKGLHIFSLSSAPEEEYIAFTTHVRKESRYKQFLEGMKPGTTLLLCGPVLYFVLRKNAMKYVFLAQGIGITPFRSLLIHAGLKRLAIKTTLIHVGQPPHTFQDETGALATKAYYPTDPEGFTARVTETIKDDGSLIYLSGSPKFVRLTKSTLRKLGVTRSRIKSDTFLGY
jgi:ferredoxin-NADP reductase